MFDVLFSHFLSSPCLNLFSPVSSSYRTNAEKEDCSIAVLTVSKHPVCSGSLVRQHLGRPCSTSCHSLISNIFKVVMVVSLALGH